MGRPPNGKTTAIGGSKNSGFRVSKPTSVKSSSPKTSNPTAAGGVGKATSDRSQLNFPYDVRLSGFTSIQNAVSKGTPKIRRILTEECDYIMECRVCRNLFRSLPNFITHKLNYCKKAFDSTWCIGLSNLVQTSERTFNIEYEVDPELLVDDKVTNSCIEKSRSVSDLYDELVTKVKAQRSATAFEQTMPADDSVVRLQIKPLLDGPTGSIVLQQRTSSDPSNCDVSSPISQPIETARRDTAIIGPDGKVMCTGTSKGIEAVVARLSAQMRTLEKKQGLSASQTAIACDTCKTVFDSDKALRQHKREGLDCGKTWGSKSPIKSNHSVASNNSQDKIKIPMQTFKSNNDEVQPLSMSNHSYGRVEVKKDSPRAPKLSSPLQSRRHSHKSLQSPTRAKRGPLSPVKKIKMKYSKLDSSNYIASEEKPKSYDSSLSCNNCSSSFNTKHEMSMHLALCNGVINYAVLRESEPPREKIRISARNEFGKVPNSTILCKKLKDENNGLKNRIDIDPCFEIPVELDNTGTEHSRDSIQKSSDLRLGPSANQVSSQIQEVNNNKQYKDETKNCISKEENMQKSVEENLQKKSLSKIKLFNVEPLETTTISEVELPCINNFVSNDGSCDKRFKQKRASQVDTKTPTVEPKKLKTVPPPKSRKSKPSKINVMAQVITRFEKRYENPQRAFNLRKAVSARVRKSSRIPPGSSLIKHKR